MFSQAGNQIYQLVSELFPINRSITGNGVRHSFEIIKNYIPVRTHEVPSGSDALDWKVPMEWNLKKAFIKDGIGKTIVDFNDNNLHVLGYSTPINKVMSLEELDEHLYSIPENPKAIPYRTSYYKKQWGFCLSHNQRKRLKKGKYRVLIESSLTKGSLTYGDLVIPGKSKREILLSTYICHPSMANDNLSGVALATFLAKWLLATKDRHYSYRFIFVPETIGALVYLNKHRNWLQKQVDAGFVLTCLGSESPFSLMPSKYGDTLADKVSKYVLEAARKPYNSYSFLTRGSDERQYCSPGIELPVVSVMRSKYCEYPEYHTSQDNLQFVTPKALEESFFIYQKLINILEINRVYQAKCLGEPQMGKRNMYPSIGMPYLPLETEKIMNLLMYADGHNDLLAINKLTGASIESLHEIAAVLTKLDLLKVVKGKPRQRFSI